MSERGGGHGRQGGHVGQGEHGGHEPGRADRFPLAAHFESPDQQYQSGKLGMWIFLVTEVLLFSGLFCAYAIYRANHPEIFFYGHRFLDTTLGGINTLVLICSSFTMAWAVRAAQTDQRRLLIGLLAATLLFALAFLGIKGIEYESKWKHGLLWGERFDYAALLHAEEGEEGGREPASPTRQEIGREPGAGAAAGGDTAGVQGGGEHAAWPAAAEGPRGLAPPPGAGAAAPAHGPDEIPRNVHQFFGIYFVLTGLHALHVIAGMGIIGWLLVGAVRGRYGHAYFTPVDFGGLYWHLVDIIWIFLFPLLYLIH